MIKIESSPFTRNSPWLEISADIAFQKNSSRILGLNYHTHGVSDSLFWVLDLFSRKPVLNSTSSILRAHFEAPWATKFDFSKKWSSKSKIWVANSMCIGVLRVDYEYLCQTPSNFRDLEPRTSSGRFPIWFGWFGVWKFDETPNWSKNRFQTFPKPF